MDHKVQIIDVRKSKHSAWDKTVGVCRCGFDTPIGTKYEVEQMCKEHLKEVHGDHSE